MRKMLTKKRIIFYSVLLLLLLVGLGYAAVATDYLGIRQISIHGCDNLSSSKIRNSLTFKKGDNILSASYKNSLKKLNNIKRIKEVTIEKNFPHQVSIFIKEKQPWILVNLDKVYGLTKNKEIIPFKSPARIPDKPIINGLEVSKDIKPFQKIKSGNLNLALRLRKAIKSYHSPLLDRVSEFYIDSTNSLITYLCDPETKVEWGSDDFRKRIKNLTLLIDKFSSGEFKNITHINLNSNKLAVLSYEKQNKQGR